MRCINANRTCLGYDDYASSAFQQYGVHGPSRSSFTITALKCSLPRRGPVPGTDILPEDKLPAEVSPSEGDLLALRAFFYDYCIIPANQKISRGFLSGLETMAHRLGLKSDLVKACQAVAYMTRGKRLNRPQLINKAKMLYQELLGSLAIAIESLSSTDSTESRLVAMLLGLFEVPRIESPILFNLGAVGVAFLASRW